jgi:U3 small nucleolar RNA-associated protein MPP10
MSALPRVALEEDIDVPQELGVLTSLIEKQPEAFALGNPDTEAAALKATKYLFDQGMGTYKPF